MNNDIDTEPGPASGVLFAVMMAIGSIIPISILVIGIGIIIAIL